MMNFKDFLAHLRDRYRALFAHTAPAYDSLFSTLAEPVLLALAAGDAPYHTVEHTLQVVSVGQAILEGKQYYERTVSPTDWLHTLVALLLHDVGYLKGACAGDRPDQHQYCDGLGGSLLLAPKATGAALMDYHVDRGKLYVTEQLARWDSLDPAIVQWHIEMTRFPVPEDVTYADTTTYGGLCRAADLLGQLSDPQYLTKLPALFEEFEETGMNRILGYGTPTDLQVNYPHFYRHVVQRYIQPSLRYLSATTAGRKIVARLYTNLRLAESVHPLSEGTTPHLKQLNSTADLLPLAGPYLPHQSSL